MVENISERIKIKNTKILIQRADRLGDCILSLPVVEALHQAYPDAQLDFICSPISTHIIKTHPLIHTCWVWKKNTKELIKKVSEQNYDLYICLWEHSDLQALGKKARIPYQIGGVQSAVSRRYFTHPISIQWRDYSRHQIQFNLDVLAPLNLDQDPPICKLYPETMGNDDIHDSKSDILIFCSSGGSNTSLSGEMVKEWVENVIEKTLYKVRLCYGDDIPDSLKKLSHPRLINRLTRVPFSDLLTLIQECSYYMGPDTGPTHMASFLNKPMLVYYSTRHNPPTRWGSQSSHHDIVRFDYLRSSKTDSQLAQCLYKRFIALTKKNYQTPAFLYEKTSYRILIPVKTKTAFKQVYQVLKPWKALGFVFFPVLLEGSYCHQLKRIHNKIKRHNISMIHGECPRWIGRTLHFLYGIQARFQPLWIPKPFATDTSIESLMKDYKKAWQNASLSCYEKSQ